MTEIEWASTTMSELAARPPTKRWGPWRLSGTYLVYSEGRGEHEYNIDLLDCTSSAEVLDWICQIVGKTWGTTEVVGHLARAFDEVLRPQERLCSFGQHLTLTEGQLRQRIRDYRAGDVL
jgi:hypothetical protein